MATLNADHSFTARALQILGSHILTSISPKTRTKKKKEGVLEPRPEGFLFGKFTFPRHNPKLTSGSDEQK
jgi:hypothetical protein